MIPSATTYMTPAERVRRQWHAFEQWVGTVPRVAMEKEISETFQDMDAKWHATPTRSRSSKQDHEASKNAFRRELEEGLVTLAREEWQRRLEQAGLRDEDWGDMTFKETLAAERLLGGDLDEEGMAIMESVARAEDADANGSGLPALTNAARATNFSGYSFVSPMSLSIGDELDDDAFESIFPFEIPASSGPESVASMTDEIFDTPTSIPWGWNGGDSSSNGIWSADTSQSSRQSSQTGSPERPPPKTMLSEQTFFPRFAEPLPQFQPDSHSASHRTRAPGPRYIGPQLADPDEVADEEAEFERFKMETRVTKIREFHEEAARADIQLAQDIYNARKTSRAWRDDEERKVAEHEKRMVELRRSKEEERKEVVRAERHKRREAIRLRQLGTTLTPMTGGAESPRQRLTQEVESKLTLGSGFIVAPEPIISPAEARRNRRHSQSTTTSQASSARSAQPVASSQADRLAASVPDLLASLETSRSMSVTSSTTSSFASSSQVPAPRPQVWLPRIVPETEVFKAAVASKPVVTKKPSPPIVDPAVSIRALPPVGPMKQHPSLWHGRTSSTTEILPSRPLSFVDALLPAATVPSSVASSQLSTPSPPTASKPIISRASSSKAKGPSPPASSKVPSPPAPSKGTSPPAPPKTQPPPAATKAPSPPAPPVETPKPSDPVVSPPALVRRKARVQAPMVEMQTPGASSSRTTLEQMQRPFIHKSLGAQQMGYQPMPAAPQGEVWVSSSSAAKRAGAGPAKAAPAPAGSRSSQIEKAPSMPQPRLPLLAETIRPRRMSDPVSPSPRGFAFADDVVKAVDPPPSILKKSKAPKQGKAKRVTVEEVSDEEDVDSMETLPVDSKVIFEPKPSVPQTMFSHIIDFSSDTPKPPAARPPALSKDSAFLTAEGKLAKEKHVRWTPSALGNEGTATRSSLLENDELRAALEGFEAAAMAPPRKGPRSRTSSLLSSGTVDRKGKGKERAVEPEVEDEFARFMMGATQDLTRG
ncbi:hypothetical protein DFH07DRAFT_522104 [Mycena maculata]|uniref:Uncharacterized protein n=1 Tax=Mycena maculata TaxID=230809 RepID=A0AAD7J1G6_9AGAR|nr:hypothetical protein DFH07DRAFT_522104 [Mycena maculata]